MAYVLVSVNEKEDRYETSLWTVGTSGSAASRRLTAGPRDSAPRWSPDGRTLAFLRAPGEKDRPQIYYLPLSGGEARKLTDLPKGAGAPHWSPDGKTIAFTSTTSDEDLAEKKAGPKTPGDREEEGARRAKQAARRHAGGVPVQQPGSRRPGAPLAHLDRAVRRERHHAGRGEAADVGSLRRGGPRLEPRRFPHPLHVGPRRRARRRQPGRKPLLRSGRRGRHPSGGRHRRPDQRRGAVTRRQALRLHRLREPGGAPVAHAVGPLHLRGREGGEPDSRLRLRDGEQPRRRPAPARAAPRARPSGPATAAPSSSSRRRRDARTSSRSTSPRGRSSRSRRATTTCSVTQRTPDASKLAVAIGNASEIGKNRPPRRGHPGSSHAADARERGALWRSWTCRSPRRSGTTASTGRR